MRGLALLSWRHMTHHRGRTAILVLCLAIALFVPSVTQVLMTRYDGDLRARAEATPLLLGAKGNRFDLTLEALYFRRGRLAPIPWAEFEAARAMRRGLAVPLHVRFTARGHPVVGTTPEYHELRGLRPARGVLPLQVGDVVLGSTVARELGLGPGDALFSDPTDLYDISKPPALKMYVCGVLARAGTPDDAAVFVDVKTAWVLEGLYHGHGEARTIAAENPELVIGAAEDSVAFSGALIEYNEVTPETAAAFHFHGDPARLPLSSVLVWPDDAKARTLMKARVNASAAYQMVAPAEVIDDLLAVVFRVKVLFDRFSIVLLASTTLLIGLVVLLTMRLRRREMDTLDRIGCAPRAVAALYALEIGGVVAASVLLAAGSTLLTLFLLPDLVRMF